MPLASIARLFRPQPAAPERIDYPKSRDHASACLPCLIAYRLGVLTCEVCGNDTVIVPKEPHKGD